MQRRYCSADDPSGELAFGAHGTTGEFVKVGILTGSLIAALLDATLIKTRDRPYERILAAEAADVDRDGIPDVYRSTPQRQT